MEIMILNIPSKFKTEDGKWKQDEWVQDVEKVIGKKVLNVKIMNGTVSFRAFVKVDDANKKDLERLERSLYNAKGNFFPLCTKGEK